MAEFKRVMGILKRKYESMGMYDFDYDKMEQEALQWEAEHPEPVYPSWLEYLMDTQPDCREAYKVGNDLLWRWMWEAPIPADIAEKLGIEPKEGQRGRVD